MLLGAANIGIVRISRVSLVTDAVHVVVVRHAE